MSFSPVNLNDFSSDLSREVANCFDPLKRGDIIGRQVITILSNKENVADLSSDPTTAELVDRVVISAFNFLQGQEITTKDSPAFESSCSSLTKPEVQQRLYACDTIIHYFQEKDKTSSIYKKIAGIIDQQKLHLEKILESDQKLPETDHKPQEAPSKITPPPLESHETVPAHLQEDLQWYIEDYLETAQLIIKSERNFGELDPMRKASCYDFFTRKDDIESLASKLSSLTGPEILKLKTLVSALQELEGQPFIKEYQSFDRLKTKLESGISEESTTNVELYLRKLIQNTDAILKTVCFVCGIWYPALDELNSPSSKSKYLWLSLSVIVTLEQKPEGSISMSCVGSCKLCAFKQMSSASNPWPLSLKSISSFGLPSTRHLVRCTECSLL